MISDRVIYVLNSAAVGDLIASAPSIKYAIEKFHSKTDYRVAVLPDFRDLFHFVPADKLINIENEPDKYPSGYQLRFLNTQVKAGCRLTPSRIKLTQFASINLLGRVLSDEDTAYIPLEKADISRYGVDFSKAVIIITTYRDRQRTILSDELRKIAEYVHSKGLIPVYVGKTGALSIWKKHLAISDFEYPGFGVDLRNDTNFKELAAMMGEAKAVIGVDGGPIHIAFTTNVPVICGFTTVAPQYRVPHRLGTRTIAVKPNIFCNFCESDWSLNRWDFSNCPRKMEVAECVTKMTSDKFIAALSQLGI